MAGELRAPPRNAAQEITNGLLAHAKQLAELTLCKCVRQLSNASHLILSQFRIGMLRAVAYAILQVPVLIVEVLVAYEEMRRIATRRIVTAMQNVCAFWQWAVRQFIGIPMGVEVVAPIFAGADTKRSIATVFPMPFPRPARLRPCRGIHKTEKAISAFINGCLRTALSIVELDFSDATGRKLEIPTAARTLDGLFPVVIHNLDCTTLRKAG